jgi:hypothetical protein
MIRRRSLVGQRACSPALVTLACTALVLLFAAGGCKKHSHTRDPRLRKIDQMLNAKLPPGTPRTRVEYFLSSRGYRIEHSPDKNCVVAVVRHIDTETLRPATARITFHFDSNDKLITYELQAASDIPLQP